MILTLFSCRSRAPTVAGIAGDDTVSGAPASVGRFTAPPVIDGKLDDAAWAGATVLGPFVDPGGGQAVPFDHPVAAQATIGWDEARIYLGFVVRDREPRSPFHGDAVDPHIWAQASGVEVMLQPGDPGDNRNYFEVQVDVAGAVWDTRFDDYNAPISGEGAARRFGHEEWSAGLERAVSVPVDGGGYTVEMALPFAALAGGARVAVPPRAGDVWRVNLYSFRDGQRQALAWSPLRGQGNFHRASRFGRVVFVTAPAAPAR